jgi:hypothetical protein
MSYSSAWNLYNYNNKTKEYELWGVVWMNENELNREYKWDNKGPYWQHKADKNKKVMAL